MLDKYSEIKIPFLIDSFIRTEVDGENQKEMFSAISKYFIDLGSQTFFTVLKENLKYVKNHDQYNKIFIDEKPILKQDKYQEHAAEFAHA